MKIWTICFLFMLGSTTFAGEPREEVHAGVRVTFQSGADANPKEIVEVARSFVDALNHQDTQKVLKYVHQGQQKAWEDHLNKKEEKRDLTVDSVLVFVGSYKIEGKRLRDQLMARIHTNETAGKGGMSFLMLFVEGKWVVAID